MSFVIIDYSELHFSSLKNAKLPFNRSGKFVQIRHFEAEYLLLSPIELSPYHANIAGRFFSKENIKGRFNKKKDYFELLDPEWEIVGGGMWTINEEEKSLVFFGSSQAYGKYDCGRLKENIFGLQGFKDYSVRTD
jgi:hypothetical protein